MDAYPHIPVGPRLWFLGWDSIDLRGVSVNTTFIHNLSFLVMMPGSTMILREVAIELLRVAGVNPHLVLTAWDPVAAIDSEALKAWNRGHHAG
jgi:hypothetical protein